MQIEYDQLDLVAVSDKLCKSSMIN